MFKKIVSLLMVAVLASTLVACGTDNTSGADDTSAKSSQSEKDDTKEEDKNNDKDDKSDIELSQTMTFMGYDISYPGNDGNTLSDYGEIVGDSNYCIIIEAPSIAGKMIDVQNINDAPELCESYVFNTLEHSVRTLFNYDSTAHEIKSKKEVTYNDVNMLLVEGTYTNTAENKVVPYSAIYLLSGDNGNLPVYLIALPMVEGYDVSEIMDTVAKDGIKKMSTQQ